MKFYGIPTVILVILACLLTLAGCGRQERFPPSPTWALSDATNTDAQLVSSDAGSDTTFVTTIQNQAEESQPVSLQPQTGESTEGEPVAYVPDVSFTLRTGIGSEGLYFQGVGGEIDNVINPELRVPLDAVVQITLVNGDGAEHDIAVPTFNAQSEHILGAGASTVLTFRASQEGSFAYFCTLPGHRQAGMEGALIVGDSTDLAAQDLPSIVRNPADLPPPLADRQPQRLQIEIETVEVESRLGDNSSYTYWTFDGEVPGPFLRVRQGDIVELTLVNREDSRNIHSIDLHAVTGPGGGAAVMQVPPGEAKTFTFKALNPGLFVYHCATPMVAHHISNGMYGLILVEPEGGLPSVDREFYIMQGELYTEGAINMTGHQGFSVDKLLAESPEYFTFNGMPAALTGEETALQAQVGETVRIFFGVGGPNFISSFHVIGEIFDRVYDQASLTAPPLTDVQTTLVPPGGATVVEFKLEVPGRYIIVDHALSRLERGLVAFLFASGEENPEVFSSQSEN